MALSFFTKKQGLPTGSIAVKNQELAPVAPFAPLGNQGGLTTTPPNVPSMGQTGMQNDQFAQLAASLGRIKEQAQNIQGGLSTLQQKETDIKGIGERFKPFTEKIGGLFGPSSEEEGLRQKLANLMSARDQGIIQAEGEAIPLRALIGETGRIERRAQAASIPLTEQLAQLQARRQGELEKAKFEFGAEKDIFGLEREEEKRQRPDETEVAEFTNEKGERVVAFRDNKTGKVRQEVLGKTEVKKTQTEKDRALKVEVAKKAIPVLEGARNPQTGFVNKETYLNLRRQYQEVFGSATGFDNDYALFLSPEDRSGLFARAGTIKKDDRLDFENI